MIQPEALSAEERSTVVKAIRRKHPHTYVVEGVTAEDPGWVVIIKHADMLPGHSFSEVDWEKVAQEVAKLP